MKIFLIQLIVDFLQIYADAFRCFALKLNKIRSHKMYFFVANHVTQMFELKIH